MSETSIERGFLKILTGSDLTTRRLPFQRAVTGEPGPVVWLTGCMHGDEVGGIAVIQEVFRILKRDGLKAGSVHAFPLMNPLGFESGSRNITPSGEDLNRSFPGDSKGSLAERMAGLIFRSIVDTEPNLVLDLHNDWRRSIPYAVLDHEWDTDPSAYQFAQQAALASGLLVVTETESIARALHRSLSGSLLAHRVPAVTLELGESFAVNERNVLLGARSVLEVLAWAGVIEPLAAVEDGYAVTNPYPGQLLTYSEVPLASRTGLIRFRKAPGDRVFPGETLARIEDAFGRHRETLVASREGVVLGSHDSAVSYPGKPVMAFGVV